MIYWINGPYGVGKSALAEKLHELNPNVLSLMLKRWATQLEIICQKNYLMVISLKAMIFGLKR